MKKVELTTFLLILVLAGGLRFSGITFDSLWLDESYQSLAEAIAKKLPDFTAPAGAPYLFHFSTPEPQARLLARFRCIDPLCPPLYALTLNRWMCAFGQSDMSCRLLSALLSLLSLALVYFMVRQAFGARAALFAGLLQGVSPLDIYYAQEVRMYSLEMVASAASTASLLALILILDENKKPAKKKALLLVLSYALSTWALINSHYTGLFTVALQGLFAAWFCFYKRSWRLLTVFVLAWLIVALLWLPWFGLFCQAAAVRTQSFYVARQASCWWPVWALFARIPFNWIVFLSGRQVFAYACPVYLTSAILLGYAAISTRKDITGRCRPLVLPLCFFWSWAFVPAALMWIVDVVEGHRVVEISRYLLATAPAIYSLAGYGCAALPAVRTLPAVLILPHALFALLNNAYAHAVPQREPWRRMASIVESRVEPAELLIVSQYYNIVCLDRYLTRAHRQIGVSPAQGASHLGKILAGKKRFWLLTAQEGEAIKDMIPKAYRLTTQINLRHALHLRLYNMEEPGSRLKQ